MLEHLPLFTEAALFPRGASALHAILASAGHSRETSTQYDHNGLKRGDREFMLFQYTLAGEGELCCEGRLQHLQKGDAMLLR
ncbi:MAG: hypothetical protein HQL31_09830, partial [Planctomycetes bacterium]|nr:hypothetical protein [Planctomycetota bacterium]